MWTVSFCIHSLLTFHWRKGYTRFRALEGWPETATAGCLLAGPHKAAAISRHTSEWGLLLGKFQPHLPRWDLSSCRKRHSVVRLSKVWREMVTTQLPTGSPVLRPDAGWAGAWELLVCCTEGSWRDQMDQRIFFSGGQAPLKTMLIKAAYIPCCLAQEEGKYVLGLRSVIRDSSLVVGSPKDWHTMDFLRFPSV